MGFYDGLHYVGMEYKRLKAKERLYSTYSKNQFIQILKMLVEVYENEEYNAVIDKSHILISPLDSDSLSLSIKLEINSDLSHILLENNCVTMIPSEIFSGVSLEPFQQKMNVYYILKFFEEFVEYRIDNSISDLDDNSLISFFNNYVETRAEDISLYQKEKNKLREEYLENEKETLIRAGFNADKYELISAIRNFINKKYNENIVVFSNITEEYNRPHDNRYYYCDFYRTIGLKRNNEIIFQIKELSYIDSKDLDDQYSSFNYCGEHCIDRNINVYELRDCKMQELIKNYTRLNEFFDKLDKNYRKMFDKNFGIIDSEKINKLVFNK